MEEFSVGPEESCKQVVLTQSVERAAAALGGSSGLDFTTRPFAADGFRQRRSLSLVAGLTLEALRSHVAAAGPAPEAAATGYAPSMRNGFRAASRHADSLRHPDIEPERLLLGLLDETDGGARRAFRHFGVDTAETMRKVFERTPDERT